MPRPIMAILALLIFVCVTLAAPFRAVVMLCDAQPVSARATTSRFASVTPQTRHAAVCACTTCAGSRIGGKCCCTGAATTGEGFTLRAVCDTAPDASAPVSPLPPVPLSRGVAVPLPRLSLMLCAGLPFAPRGVFAPRSPLPPDAPPRFLS